MEKNPYRDLNGHYTTKENDGQECPHNFGHSTTPIHLPTYHKTLESLQKTKAPDGTYNIFGEEIQDRFGKNGYQISIYRPEITEVLLEDEIEELIDLTNQYLDTSDSDIGFFGGSGEISSFTKNIKKTMTIAKLFNQESALNWKLSKDKDNPYFIDNPYYNKNYKMTKKDYEKAKQTLLKLLNEDK